MDEVKDGSVDLIFTSPPYWNKRTYDDESSGLGNEKSPKEYVENLVSHFRDSKRVLKDTGSFFLVLGDTYLNKNLQNIPHRVTIGLQDEGWILRNTIIWKKTNPKPVSSKDNLSPSYEFIFHLVKTHQYKIRHSELHTQMVTHRDSDGFLDTENLIQTNYPQDSSIRSRRWKTVAGLLGCRCDFYGCGKKFISG